MVILKLFKHPSLKPNQLKCKLEKLSKISGSIKDVDAEYCYYIESKETLKEQEVATLKWILTAPFGEPQLTDHSALKQKDDAFVVEIGPRFVHIL